MWYNPPYSKNVWTNVGQSFLKIIDEEFPQITHCTRYSTVIQSRLVTAVCQTSSRLSMETTNPRCPQFPARVALTCVVAPKTIKNCMCPLSNKCRITESVVYQATVTIKVSLSQNESLYFLNLRYKIYGNSKTESKLLF